MTGADDRGAPALLRTQKLLGGAVLLIASLLGVGAFLYPFFWPAVREQGTQAMAHAVDAPLIFVLLLVLCLVAVVTSLTGRQMTSKMVALLGVLTALGAAMRALPGPGGANAIFFLPILAGFCYGPTFGFLLGSLSLLVSALIGAGVGPWLPYQMFATGWMGLLSGFLPEFPRRPWLEPPLLAVWGALLGMVFGAIMNLWFWPYIAGPAGQAANSATSMVAGGAASAWQPGMSFLATVRSYLAFYVATSLLWDLARSAGNALLLLLLARPVLRVLRRFRSRFRFDVVPQVAIAEAEQPHSSQVTSSGR
jgi:energy-coupling factor transport system substrate-specific component